MSWWNQLPVVGGFLPGSRQSSVKNRDLGEGGKEVRDAAGNIVRTAGNRQARDVSGASIDQSNSEQNRRRQQRLADSLEGVANGTAGPSVAEEQAKRNQDSNLRQMRGAQASTRGGAGPLANKDILDRESLALQESAEQNAQLRAQEVATARGQLGSVLDSSRGQDINVSTAQGQMDLQSQMANAENELRSRGMNDEAIKAALVQQFGVDNTNLSAGLKTDELNAGIESKNIAADAAQRSNFEDLGGKLIGLASDERLKKPTATNARPEELSREHPTAKSSHDAVVRTTDYLGKALDFLTGTKDREGKASVWSPQARKPTGPVQDELDRAGEEQGNDADENARYDSMSHNDIQRALDVRSARDAENEKKWAEQHESAVTKHEARVKTGLEAPNADEKRANMAEAQKKLGLVKSDERSKTSTSKRKSPLAKDADKKADMFMRALEPITYEYRDKSADGDGEWLGVSAQRVEKAGPAGRDMVDRDDRNMRVLDMKKLTSALAASVARLEKKKANK